MENFIDVHHSWFVMFYDVILGLWGLCSVRTPAIVGPLLCQDTCYGRSPVLSEHDTWYLFLACGASALSGHLLWKVTCSFRTWYMIHDVLLYLLGTLSGYLFLHGHLLWRVTCAGRLPVLSETWYRIHDWSLYSSILYNQPKSLLFIWSILGISCFFPSCYLNFTLCDLLKENICHCLFFVGFNPFYYHRVCLRELSPQFSLFFLRYCVWDYVPLACSISQYPVNGIIPCAP